MAESPADKNVNNKRQEGGQKNRRRKGRASRVSKKKVKTEKKADSNSKVNSVRGLECA